MNKSVAVVILNYNGRHYLEQFLPSVIASTYTNLHVYVADNASTDDSIVFLQTHFSSVSIIPLAQNYGFAGGYNRALANLKEDYLVLLNSDVEVERSWIEPVIAALEANNSWAAAQPKILSYREKDRFEHAGAAGGYLDPFGFPFCRGRIMDVTELDRGQYNHDQEVFWASGAAFFIRNQAWQETGGFDEDFFAHMEEIDLCWRLKRMGYGVGAVMNAQVYHVGGGTLAASNPRKTYLNFRNSLFMIHKNLPFFKAILHICIRLWIDLFALIHFALNGKGADARAVSQAHRSFFGSFWNTVAKRKRNTNPYLKRSPGFFGKSIVWVFYVQKIRYFSGLKIK